MKRTILLLLTAMLAVSCFERLEFGADYKPEKEEQKDPEDPDDPQSGDEPVDISYPDNGSEVKSVVFESGKDNHIYFRIPAITETKKGTLLAFCEARNTKADFYVGHQSQFEGISVYQPGDSNDTGDIDLVLKRSTDGGASWGKMITLFDDGNNVCGNPAPVVDWSTGRIWLFWCWQKCASQPSNIFPSILDGHNRRVLYSYSDDDGLTWSTPVDMTSTLKDRTWTWYATGPNHATQLISGPNKGRLIVPANHRDAANKINYSHCFYSDDHGKTWVLGGVTQPAGNESCITELSDGNILTSMRIADSNLPEGTNGKCRAFSKSTDGGASWGSFDIVESLIDPGCQGAVANYHKGGEAPSSTLLLSNCHHASSRRNMTISVSKNDGKDWTSPYAVFIGRAAYSDIYVLYDGSVAVFYENGYGKYGTASPNEQISFHRIPPSLVASKLGL